MNAHELELRAAIIALRESLDRPLACLNDIQRVATEPGLLVGTAQLVARLRSLQQTLDKLLREGSDA